MQALAAAFWKMVCGGMVLTFISAHRFLAVPAVMLMLTLAQAAQAQEPRRILPGANPRTPITIDAERLEFADKEQKLVYTGRVMARQGESSMSASVLTISLAPKEDASKASGAEGGKQAGAQASAGPLTNSQVRHMDAAGPVTVTSKDQIGRGDKGVYDKTQNRVFLIGNVSLSRGDNVARGNRLVYDLDSGHAQITGGVRSFFKPPAKGAEASARGRAVQKRPRT